MLSDIKSSNTRFTKAELEDIRKRTTRNGYRIGQIKNHEEAMAALMKALHRGVIDDMMEFLNTGTSPLTSCTTVEEFEKQLHESTAGC